MILNWRLGTITLYMDSFIAILLVVFTLDAYQAMEEFIDLSVSILEKQEIDAEGRTAALKQYINQLLEKYDIQPDTPLLDQSVDSKNCKLYVSTAGFY